MLIAAQAFPTVSTKDPDAMASPPAATWHVTAADLMGIAVWSQKRPGLGEDAEPTFLRHGPSRRGLLGVYDGLGGAGARQAGTSPDGRSLSHAFVASRLAALTVQSWFHEHVAGHGAPDLHERLVEVLGAARSTDRPKVTGTLRRDFPTTMALVEYEQTGDALEVTARWAGDSRCYVLTPGQGLHQISEDDTEVRDILDLLIDDQPMVNLVSASTEFAVNTRCIAAVSLPCVVLCATDGFFGYVATPALFEHVLLGELRQSRDLGDWAHRLTARVRDYTADDASLCLAAFGFGTFHLLRDRFDRRFRELHRDHAAPLAAVDSREGLVAARRRSWEAYRGQYLRYLEPFGTGAVDVEGSGRR